MEDLKLPHRLPLTRPIEHNGDIIDALTFDEPDLDAQICLAELYEGIKDAESPTDVEALRVNRFWIARLAAVSEAVAGKIKSSDEEAVMRTVNAILDQGKGVEDGQGNGGADPAQQS